MILKIALAVLGLVALGVAGLALYYPYVANPRVERELLEDPDGERARREMLITLPSGRRLPVNYWRDGEFVYAAADGGWWKELAEEASPVTVLVRGETLSGQARAVTDDPEHTARVFAELRPNAIKGFGTLVEVKLDGPS
jgi:hypothetical protein